MKDFPLAYLVNQYPKTSHSFIRREIVELERQGFSVLRLALRGADQALADPADRAERVRTRYVLAGMHSSAALLVALLRMLATRPAKLLGAAVLALKMSRRGARPLPIHLAYLAEACRIVPWLEQARVHHLHAHFGTNAAEVAMLAARLGGPPYSFTVHGPEEFEQAGALHLADKVARAAFVVAVSSFGRSQLYRLLPQALWPKVHVVHCGLDQSFQQAPRAAPPAPACIVCVGRLCAQKAQLLLLEALAQLRRDGLHLELVLAGDGEMRPAIEARVAQLGLQENVRITGWLSGEQVRAHILAAAALVLPSFAEGLPVAIMEAMALRRPVLSTYIAGIPELLRHGEHGWLFPAGDADALAQALRAFLATPPATRAAMGRAARRRVLARHAIATEVAKLARCIRADHPAHGAAGGNP
jgi:colanic acid/amylovoran biosynthesis glycosyltransferase